MKFFVKLALIFLSFSGALIFSEEKEPVNIKKDKNALIIKEKPAFVFIAGYQKDFRKRKDAGVF